MDATEDIYLTSDFPLAVYLYTSGIKLRGTNRTNVRRAVFIFNKPPEDVLADWVSGRAVVNALAFYNSYQTLKGELWRAER
jgi:hypothetical protein